MNIDEDNERKERIFMNMNDTHKNDIIDRNNINDRNSDDSVNKNRYRGMNVGMLWVCWIGKGIQLTYEYIVQEIIEK